MHSFFGVPVRVRGEIFSDVAAGVAIDNARLLAEGERQQAWPAAAREIASRSSSP
ncbi:hypothetical protein [Streptomyces roseochromogenus]|nr:hypothetical protein [Streptomyces roseochromogenus]